MAKFEIPCVPSQAQKFTVELAGVTYGFKLRFNNAGGCWIIDIADATGNPLVSGLPMITGADLLEQYGYLGIGGQLIATTDYDPGAPPTFDNLGVTGHLYFVTPD